MLINGSANKLSFLWFAVLDYTVIGLLQNRYETNKQYCNNEPDSRKARITL